MKVLLIEDNPVDLLKLKYMVADLDYELRTINSMAEVRAVFEAGYRDFDLIISDIRLEEGLVFELQDWPDLPTIFISAFEEEDYLASAMRIKQSFFLNKPFTPLTLKAAMIRLLEDQQLQEPKFITVFGKHKNPIRLALDQILYIQSEGNYATVFLTNKEKYMVKRSAKFLVEQLGGKHFVQVQRAAYVHAAKISKVFLNQNKVLVGGGHNLSISKSFKKNIYEYANL